MERQSPTVSEYELYYSFCMSFSEFNQLTFRRSQNLQDKLVHSHFSPSANVGTWLDRQVKGCFRCSGCIACSHIKTGSTFTSGSTSHIYHFFSWSCSRIGCSSTEALFKLVSSALDCGAIYFTAAYIPLDASFLLALSPSRELGRTIRDPLSIHACFAGPHLIAHVPSYCMLI